VDEPADRIRREPAEVDPREPGELHDREEDAIEILWPAEALVEQESRVAGGVDAPKKSMNDWSGDDW
jgi:hypothetical protein